MASKWTVLEKLYLLYWDERGITADMIARDLDRPLRATEKWIRWFKQSGAGRAERARLVALHGKLRDIAKAIVEVEKQGVDIDAWLDNAYAMNDFQAAEMPEEFGPLPYHFMAMEGEH